MKHLLTLFIILTLTSAYSQKSNLVGTWKTLSVDTGQIFINAKTDSVSVSPELKKSKRTAVGLQDAIAGVRVSYSYMHFVFGKDGSFQQYLTERMDVAPLFTGTYTIKGDSITINVKNRAGNELTKKMPFRIVNSKLHLTIDARPGIDAGTKFILERIK